MSIKLHISTEAAKALTELTPQLGPWISTDTSTVVASFEQETLRLLMEYQQPGDTINETIIRLCNAYRRLREVR